MLLDLDGSLFAEPFSSRRRTYTDGLILQVGSIESTRNPNSTSAPPPCHPHSRPPQKVGFGRAGQALPHLTDGTLGGWKWRVYCPTSGGHRWENRLARQSGRRAVFEPQGLKDGSRCTHGTRCDMHSAITASVTPNVRATRARRRIPGGGGGVALGVAGRSRCASGSRDSRTGRASRRSLSSSTLRSSRG